MKLKVGLGLRGLPRQSFRVSTKSRPVECPTADDVRRSIEESLRKLQLDRLDFYQVWGLNLKDFNAIVTRPAGMLTGIRRAMDDGLIGHLGTLKNCGVFGVW